MLLPAEPFEPNRNNYIFQEKIFLLVLDRLKYVALHEKSHKIKES